MFTSMPVRNERLGVTRSRIAGGSLVLCLAPMPVPARAPTSSEILSQHAIPTALPVPTNGEMLIPDIAPDPQANATGVPGWWAVLQPDGALVHAATVQQAPVTLALPAGQSQIVAGTEVRVLAVKFIEPEDN